MGHGGINRTSHAYARSLFVTAYVPGAVSGATLCSWVSPV